MADRRHFGGSLAPALRRVDGVRLVVGVHPIRAEVYGIGHRLPVTRPVSMRLAAQLVEAGAPLSVAVETEGPAPDEDPRVRPPAVA